MSRPIAERKFRGAQALIKDLALPDKNDPNGAGTFEAGRGDFVYVPRNTRHGFKNIGTETGTLMVFYTPAGAERFFLDHADDPDPNGAPPPEWTAERFEAMGDALAAHNMILLPKGDD